MFINGIKFACNTCVKGHRSSNCNHFERPLIEIRKKGRPVTQCSFCRDLRKTKQVHVKCNCTDKSETIALSHQQHDCTTGDHSISFKGASVMVDPIANQCTCHEIQKPVHQTQTQPIMMKMSDGSHIVLPLKKSKLQRMTIDSPYSDNKSPRRRRSYPMRNISTANAFYHSDNPSFDMTSLPEPTLLMEMQSFLLPNSLLTARDTDINTQSAHSISSASSCSSSCSSPSIPSRYDIYRESSTSLSDVNNLISHVLEEEPVYSYEDMMTRSNTSTHPTPQSQWMCGSLIPHQSCPPLHLQTSGESIMLTITPLMNCHSPDIIQPSLDKPASTRILTCYFGSNCICPECMVHPHQ